MRLLETFILITLLPALLAPFWRRSRAAEWPALFPVLAALLTLLHLFLEGYRWQMVPAYVLVLLLVARAGWRLARPAVVPEQGRGWRLAGALGSIGLFLIAVALSLIFPVPELPWPRPERATAAVGTATYHLVDPTRPEIYTEAPDDVREIMVQVWYPAIPEAGAETAPYLEAVDVAGPAVAERLNLPPFLLDHIDLVKTHSYPEAQPMEGDPYPLLVFSHGLRGLRAQNTVLMETLASHGYVVASIDHTYGNVLTVFPDGDVAFYKGEMIFDQGEPNAAGGARLIDVWGADVRFVLDQIAAWQESDDHLLAGLVNLERVGTLGHSTGGGTAVEVCALDERCDGVVGLDAWMEPVSPPLRADYPKPIMFLSAPEWLGPENEAIGRELYAGREDRGYLLTVAGTEHFDFSDLPLLSPLTPLLGLSGEIESERALAIINSYTLAFFDQTLKGDPAPLLDGPSAQFPEVDFGAGE